MNQRADTRYNQNHNGAYLVEKKRGADGQGTHPHPIKEVRGEGSFAAGRPVNFKTRMAEQTNETKAAPEATIPAKVQFLLLKRSPLIRKPTKGAKSNRAKSNVVVIEEP